MRKYRIVIRVTIEQDCTCMKSNQQLDVFSYREGLIINECIHVFMLSDSTCLIHMLCDMLTTWEVQVRRSLKTEFFFATGNVLAGLYLCTRDKTRVCHVLDKWSYGDIVANGFASCITYKLTHTNTKKQ